MHSLLIKNLKSYTMSNNIIISRADSFDDLDDTIIAVPILMECDKDEDFSEEIGRAHV